jgi:ABC-type transporter Mla maintaining outer membrane lipid asymmetry ATPase subunit MlaF
MSPDDPRSGGQTALIDIRNVVKRFGANTVLDDVSVAVAEGLSQFRAEASLSMA